MAKLKGKKLWQTIGSVALAIVTFVGVAFGISAIAKKADEETEIINPKFEIGGLTSTGKYEETNGSIYTKEAFKCQGLQITPEFDSAVKYQIFFYDDLGNFVNNTLILDGYYTEEIPVGSSYARIEITPDWSFLGITDKDEQIVKWYEVNKYAKQIEISVLKEQKSAFELWEEQLESYEKIELNNVGPSLFAVSDAKISSNSQSPWYFYDCIDVSNYSALVLKVPTALLGAKVSYNNVENSHYAFVAYDIANQKTYFYDEMVSEGIFKEIKTEETFTYIEFDTTNMTDLVFAVNKESVDFVEAWGK